MTENINQTMVLVTGGSGKTGARVVQRLAKLDIPHRIGARSTSPAFDWGNQATWPRALAGTSAVYIAYSPDLAAPGAPDVIRAFTRMAADLGVKQLVLLSGRGEPEAEICERIVQQAGLDWTILRASWFNQNFSENFLADGIRNGEVVLPLGDVKEPFIDADDIADIAVAALTEPGHAGQLYEITGPRLLSFRDAVAEIATATGREIAYVQVPMDDYFTAMAAEGVPADYLALIRYLFETVLDGRNASTTNDVERALKRRPRDLAEFARAAAASGAWAK